MTTMLKGAKKTTTKTKTTRVKAPKIEDGVLRKRVNTIVEKHLDPGDKTDRAVAEKLGVTITAPNFKTVEITIRGTSPYVQNAFSKKAREIMRAKQAEGSTAASKGKKREAKDFDAAFKDAQHRSTQNWPGIPASAIKNALVDSCVVVGYHKTKAKKAIFVEADGFDAVEGTPLIKLYGDKAKKLTYGTPKHVEHMVKLPNGTADIRVRAMYDNWQAKVRVRFDADMFKPADIANLMLRAGMQVGIGEGRADSPSGCGMGWGHFECVR
jgi:hypothetical protein